MLFVVLHRCPTYDRRLYPIDDAVGDIQKRDAFGTQQVFVSIRRKRIDAISIDIKFQTTETLNHIHDKDNAALPAELANTSQIRAEPACELDPAYCENASAMV